MIKSALKVLARVVLSLAVALGVLWFGVLQPHQQSIEYIGRFKNRVLEMQKALDRSAEPIRELARPAELALGKGQVVRQYVQSLASIEDDLNVLSIEEPKAQNIYWRDKTINNFNELLKDKVNILALTNGLTALRQAYTWVDHQAQTMSAVASLMDYDPSADIKGQSHDVIIDKMEAAAGGLQSTLQKLDRIAAYKGDSLKAVRAQVAKVEAARQAYFMALSAGRNEAALADHFIQAVHEAQHFIAADRNQFWVSHRGDTVKKLKSANTLLLNLTSGLNNV